MLVGVGADALVQEWVQFLAVSLLSIKLRSLMLHLNQNKNQ